MKLNANEERIMIYISEHLEEKFLICPVVNWPNGYIPIRHLSCV